MKLVLLNNAEKTIPIQASLQEKTVKDRFLSASKTFALWFILALGSILIPVAHFVLVPTFLIVALVSFFQVFKITNKLNIIGEYNCCQCDKPLIIKNEIHEDSKISCEYCFQKYKIIF